jgi:hypothetical protein
MMPREFTPPNLFWRPLRSKFIFIFSSSTGFGIASGGEAPAMEPTSGMFSASDKKRACRPDEVTRFSSGHRHLYRPASPILIHLGW